MKPFQVAIFAALLVACKDDKKTEVTLAPTASALAPSTASTTAMTVKFTVNKGTTSLEMPAPQEKIKAETTEASGDLQIDIHKLDETRGIVKVDLSKLVTKTFDDAKKNETQSEHAQTWFEISDKFPADVREKNRFAEFAIRSINEMATSDLTKIAATKEADADVRTANFTAKGELLVHGHKVPRDVKLEAKFYYPAGAAADSKPTKVVVKTREPLKVILAEHDIKPRDEAGKLAQKAFSLLGTKVADVAEVSLEITAAP